MKFTALLFVVFASCTACETTDYTTRINSTCVEMPDRKIEVRDECVICYAKGRAVVACEVSSP